jgi:hypothetical protein
MLLQIHNLYRYAEAVAAAQKACHCGHISIEFSAIEWRW